MGASVPSWKNVGGAMGRPKASKAWSSIQRSLSGDLSEVEGKDGPVQIPTGGLPIFWLALLANGNFIYPVGFNMNAGSTKEAVLFQATKGIATIGTLATAFAFVPKLRFPIGLSVAGYAAYVRFYLLEMFDQVWKVKTPARRELTAATMLPTEVPALITISGFRECMYHQRALGEAREMSKKGHVKKVVDRTFATRREFQDWLLSKDGRCRFGPGAQTHTSSPFVWIGEAQFLGGCEDLLRFAQHLEDAEASQGRSTIRSAL